MGQFENIISEMNVRMLALNNAINGVQSDITALKATIGSPTSEQIALLDNVSNQLSNLTNNLQSIDAQT